MALPLKRTSRSLRIQGLIDAAFKVVMPVTMIFLAQGYLDQRSERNCRFELTTETDRIDSDLDAKQAQIFEALILRPSPEGEMSEEVVKLGVELQELLEQRTEAYERREDATERCD